VANHRSIDLWAFPYYIQVRGDYDITEIGMKWVFGIMCGFSEFSYMVKWNYENHNSFYLTSFLVPFPDSY
jgi:hypothetical protein